MHFARLLLLQGSVATLLAACGGADSQATAQPVTAAQPARGMRPPPSVVTVPAQERETRPRVQGGRLQVGVPRQVPATADPASTARLLNWQRGAGSSAAALTFKVEGARGLRAGLLVRKLPAGAVIRGYVQDGATLFQATGDEVLGAIAANRRAGDLSDDGATWWTPVIDGPELTLEIQLPAGATPDEVEIAVPRISQLSIDPAGVQKNLASIGAPAVTST